jgi:hypothetical protein
MDFIKVHLISKIAKNYRKMKTHFSHDGFFFFNDKVGDINRIGRGLLYKEEVITPSDWRKIKGTDLIKILKQIEENKFYFHKEINGRFYKTRPKNVRK